MSGISEADLRSFATNLLAQGGFGEELGQEMADLLVWADLRGVSSHGVLRIPRYLEMLELGLVRADGEIAEVQRKGAVCLLDAGKAPGATAMNRAVQEASSLAGKHGLGWCAVRHTSHAGAIGYFTEQLANQGLVGMAMTASKPLMTYHGAKGEVLSTNPISIAVPRADGDPFILDMSTAAVALGKIMAAKDKGSAIPEGWAVDDTGASTTDPFKVDAVLPMAGAKGSGLSLMIEILVSLLAGNPNIAPSLNGAGGGGFNGMVLAIDPAAFGDADRFLNQASALAAAIGALSPAPGFDKVRLPGQRGYETAGTRREKGIELAAGTRHRLAEAAGKLGVMVPAGFTDGSA